LIDVTDCYVVDAGQKVAVKVDIAAHRDRPWAAAFLAPACAVAQYSCAALGDGQKF
jgi:hypothetical protein